MKFLLFSLIQLSSISTENAGADAVSTTWQSWEILVQYRPFHGTSRLSIRRMTRSKK